MEFFALNAMKKDTSGYRSGNKTKCWIGGTIAIAQNLQQKFLSKRKAVPICDGLQIDGVKARNGLARMSAVSKRQKTCYDTQNWLPPEDDERAGSSVCSSIGEIDLRRNETPHKRVSPVIVKTTYGASCPWTASCTRSQIR